MKVISHSTASEAERAGNEVKLSMRLKHRNVVRCLYFEVVTLPLGLETALSLRPHLEEVDSSASGSQGLGATRVGW